MRDALRSYCAHAGEADALVAAIQRGEYANQDRRANIRVFELEAAFSADATELRREAHSTEASNVDEHSRVLREFINTWFGRGPNPGFDMYQDYYRASDQSRAMCA